MKLEYYHGTRHGPFFVFEKIWPTEILNEVTRHMRCNCISGQPKSLIATLLLVSPRLSGPLYKELRSLPRRRFQHIQYAFYTMATWTANPIIQLIFIIL